MTIAVDLGRKATKQTNKQEQNTEHTLHRLYQSSYQNHSKSLSGCFAIGLYEEVFFKRALNVYCTLLIVNNCFKG